MMETAVELVILVAVYSAILAGVVWLIRRLEAPKRRTIFMSFLTFGLAAGILTMLLWPHDSYVLPNVFGVWLGDWIYVHAIGWIGEPHSSQAHDTIPWVLQVPQVYAIASTGLCASVGLVLQWIYERSRKPASARTWRDWATRVE
jgi:hypothetical protein